MTPGEIVEVMDKEGRVYFAKVITTVEPGYFRCEWIEGPKDGGFVVASYDSAINADQNSK